MKTIVTHDGDFHVDDVFAVATLLLVYPEAKVIRSRDEEVIRRGDIVVDVGGIYDQDHSRFDHHQEEGAGEHANGIPYASFGLVWRSYGEALSGGSAEVALQIEERLTMPIDAIDNGVDIAISKFPGIRSYSIGDYIYSYLDKSTSDPEYLLGRFIKVVGIAKELLIREIANATAVTERRKEAKKLLEEFKDEPIAILSEDLPWQSLVEEYPKLRFVIYPRKNGSWGIKAVPETPGSFVLRKAFPRTWAGKKGADLIQCTGIEDALFAHKAGYLTVALTKEGALKLAELALHS